MQATEHRGMFNALFRYPEEYRWARAFVKHVRLRAESGEIGACSGHALARGARIWRVVASRARAGQRGGVGSGR